MLSTGFVSADNGVLDGTANLRVPACGVGLIAAQNVTIEDNCIVDNGVQLLADDEPVARGLRGVIVIVEATPVRGFTFPQSTTGPTLDPACPRSRDRHPATRWRASGTMRY